MIGKSLTYKIFEKRPSIAIFHDYFAIRGGGERLVLELARELEASMVYGYATEQGYDSSLFPEAATNLELPTFLRRYRLHLPALAQAFARQGDYAAQFDTRIFSGVCAPLAAPARHLAGRNIFYCHTPPRFLYDQRDFFLKRSSVFSRWGVMVVGRAFQRSYERAISRMHLIIANSENVQRRIKRYLGRDSIVVYPPCDTHGFVWAEPQGYYLSTARLSALKRVDRIVDAFRAMPDKNLVVASGGEDAEALRRRAADAPNIRFTGWNSEAELRALVGGAIATIYVPVDEDFGMSPVESMAAGKPVIGVAEGGLLETVVDGETGILLPGGFTANELAEAVNWLTPERALAMREASEKRAALFSRERFVGGMRRAIATVHAS